MTFEKSWLQLAVQKGSGLLQALCHTSKPCVDTFGSPVCVQLGQVLENIKLELNSFPGSYGLDRGRSSSDFHIPVSFVVGCPLP